MGLGHISRPTLYLSILIIAICGIIYELIIGTVSSYLWGDSVWYFSMTIGLYMSALGLGAYLSRFIRRHLFDWFVLTEILVALVGGLSALFLFWIYATTELYEGVMVIVTISIGTFVGLEIPLLIRILEETETLRKNVSHVLTYDYMGGLLGALVFPLLLLPSLGLIRTALVVGLANLAVVGLNFWRNRALFSFSLRLLFLTGGMSLLIGYFLFTSQSVTEWIDQKLYRDQVIFTTQTHYQHLTLTQWHHDIRLFINGNLQFSSIDEYRYHESLIHVPLAAVSHPQSALVIGGGDGLAVRELLKYPTIAAITLVDLDPEIIQMAQTHPLMKQLNQGSLDNSKVTLVFKDGYKFVEQDTHTYDAIIVDLPDPSQTSLGKLYSLEFYSLLKKRLNQQGVLVTQSTSPFFAKLAFWCIFKTLKATGLSVLPYHVDVPSFGDWGFQLASQHPLEPATLTLAIPHQQLHFLTVPLLPSLFILPKDLQVKLPDIEVNTLIKPVLLQYYHQGWNTIR